METKRLYKNKEWLKKKYIEEEILTVQIAKLCGVYNTTIGKWLKRFNISRYSRAKAAHLSGTNHHCNLKPQAIEWLNGELLGDGSIQYVSPYSAYFVYSSKYFEYIEYIKSTLKLFGLEGGKIIKRYHKERNYYSYFYRTYCYAELLPLRNKWYPEGKKIIPKDLKLTPITLKQEYIGDGSLIHIKDGRPYVSLCTNGFSVSDVEWLLKQIINLGIKATRQPAVNIIAISTHSTKDFLNYIGNSPVKCYNYKFEY